MKITRQKFITQRYEESDVVSKTLMNLPFLHHLSYTCFYLLFLYLRFLSAQQKRQSEVVAQTAEPGKTRSAQGH